MASAQLFMLPAESATVLPDHKASLSQYLTPGWAAAELTDRALLGLGPVRVLEPSCGAGSFLAAIPATCPAIGVEIDPALAQLARNCSGRHVITSDFQHADLEGFQPDVILGNPPFTTEFFDILLERAFDLLPQEGRVSMIIPTHFLQTPSRVDRWNERFAIETQLLPRTLFPGLSKTITWTNFIKSNRRTLVGLLLFRETSDIEKFRNEARANTTAPTPWKTVVSDALGSLGGEGDLRSIYDRISPCKRIDHTWWREKVRQTLGRHFISKGQGRWQIPQSQMQC